MSDLTEEQQVERLREWWAKNGMVVIIAIAAFAAGFIGITQWRASQQSHSEGASLVFDDAVEAADNADITLLVQSRNRLLADYADTPYASQAGLRLAGLYVQRGETDEAERVLAEVLAAERGTLLAPIVAERLARVQIYRETPEAALQTIEGVSAGVYSAMLDTVKGDALAALGRIEDAEAAYRQAIAAEASPQLIDPVLVNMKLAALRANISAAPAPQSAPAADEAPADDEAQTP